MNTAIAVSANKAFELRFRSLFVGGDGFTFPCNAAGQVDVDSLDEKARNNYFYARHVVGMKLSMPAIQTASSPLH